MNRKFSLPAATGAEASPARSGWPAQGRRRAAVKNLLAGRRARPPMVRADIITCRVRCADRDEVRNGKRAAQRTLRDCMPGVSHSAGRHHGLRRLCVTTRRDTIAVAGVAILAASSIQARDWWRLRIRCAGALRDYARSTKRYEEGRVAFWDYLDVSQRLMEAELDLSSRRGQQVDAITDHLSRVSRIIDEERKHTTICRGINGRDAAIIEESLEKFKASWGPWVAAGGIDELLDQCKAKLQKLREAN